MEGTQLGPYRVLGDLGSGGMGRVYLAEVAGKAPGLDGGCRVALKVIHPHLLETPGFFKRFLREAEIGREIEHENVVRTYDCDALLHDGVQQNFLVMEYVEGQTLRGLLEDLERVPEELCRHIGREVGKGLAAIHEAGAIHRDLKPENVLITGDHQVKIMDLGVARLQDEVVRLSQTGAFVGSIHYAAPEQFRGGVEADHRVDLHGLGLLLYELACGEHPYFDEDFRVVIRRLLHEAPRRIHELNPQVSPLFEEVVHTLLEKDRDDRFASAAEVACLLDEGEEGTWWTGRAQALRTRSRRPSRRIRIPRETALYGRDADLARLRALYERAQAGDGQVLLIEGEAGIGKTRLVDEFVGCLLEEGEDLNFPFGGYPPSGATAAAGGLSTALREQFGADGSGAYLAETPRLVPAFDAMLRGDAPPEGSEPLTRDSLGASFVRAVRALGVERTTILLIDDLHFAPGEARELFTALALAVPGHRVLLVGTMRPGIPGDWVANISRLDHATHAHLERLGPKDLTELLVDAFHSERLAEDLGFRIAGKSDGNPFFAFEIIRGLREGQFITQKPDGTWVTTQMIEEIQIPASVLDLVNARVADLDETERTLLDAAACLGFQFDPGLVGDALGLPRIATLRAFGQIERRHRLVRAAGRSMVFDHHQVQEALYGSMLEQLREAYHGALAGALETREMAREKTPRELDGALCVELCEHFLRSGEGKRSGRYLRPALEHLKSGYLHDQAVALGERALAHEGLVEGVDRIDTLLFLAERFDAGAKHDRQHAVLTQAEDLARKASDVARLAQVSERLGWTLHNAHELTAAEEVLQRAIALGEEAKLPRVVADAMVTLGDVLAAQGRLSEGETLLRRGLEVAREHGEQRSESWALADLGSACFRLGKLDEARACYERANEIANDMGRLREVMLGTLNTGNVFLFQGCTEEARSHFARGLGLAREIGHRGGEAGAVSSLAHVCWDLGLLTETREYHERALELARETGDRLGEVWGLVGLAGPLLVSLGDPEAGRELLDEALALCREIGARPMEAFTLAGLGVAAANLGDAETAECRYREAIALYRATDDHTYVGMTLVDLGALLAEQGRAGEASTLLDEARDAAEAMGVPSDQVSSRCHQALLPGGDGKAARAVFKEYRARLPLRVRMEAHFLLWKVDEDPADLTEAHRLLLHQRDHAPQEYRRSMLEEVPLHREIGKAWASR